MIRRPLKVWSASRIARVRVYLVALWKLFKHPQTPKPAKWVAAAVLAYALSPIDLIPDFIPVLGYADDAIIVTAVLRSVVRRAGIDAVRAQWPGTDDGFAAIARLTGLDRVTP